MIIRKAYTGADGITRIAELSELDIAELKAEFKKQLNKLKEELMDDFTRDKLTLSFDVFGKFPLRHFVMSYLSAKYHMLLADFVQRKKFPFLP